MPLYEHVISPQSSFHFFSFLHSRVLMVLVLKVHNLYGEASSGVIFLVPSQESPEFVFFIVSSLIGEKTTGALARRQFSDE